MSDARATTQVYSIYIDAPAEKVYEALTSPEWSTKFGYGGRAEMDLRPGGAYVNHASNEMKQMGMPDVVVNGEIVEADPPNRLVLMWSPVWLDEPATQVTYDLQQFESGLTRLTLTHDVTGAPETAVQVDGRGNPDNGGGGWPWVLAGLKTAIETGRPMTGSGGE